MTSQRIFKHQFGISKQRFIRSRGQIYDPSGAVRFADTLLPADNPPLVSPVPIPAKVNPSDNPPLNGIRISPAILKPAFKDSIIEFRDNQDNFKVEFKIDPNGLTRLFNILKIILSSNTFGVNLASDKTNWTTSHLHYPCFSFFLLHFIFLWTLQVGKYTIYSVRYTHYIFHFNKVIWLYSPFLHILAFLMSVVSFPQDDLRF